MKSYCVCCVFLLWLLCPSTGACQFQDLVIYKNLRKIDVPFEYSNNFIIVKLVFNDVFPLKFILDTGAEHTILTKREISDLMHVNYQRRFPIMGADMKTELYAYLATGVRLKISNMYFLNNAILVLEDDYFKFEESAGMDVHGIIGADILKRFVIKIDYSRRVITFYDPSHYKHSEAKSVQLNSIFKRNKPYIFTKVTMDNDHTYQTKLLMDTGASLALLLHTNTNLNIVVPPNVVSTNIGMGLGGTLEGFVGRVPALELCEQWPLNAAITNFQDIGVIPDTSFLYGRHGILGNQVLNRFIITIDYPREKVYVEPGKLYKQKFNYDRSGLSLICSGANLNVFTATFVVDGSPAAEAGMQKGDEIKSINGVPASVLSLQELLVKLQKKPGKRIKIVARRNGQKMKFEFTLRELI